MSFVFMCYVKCIARVFVGKPNRTVLLFSKQYGETFRKTLEFQQRILCVNKFSKNALFLRFRRIFLDD